MVGYAPSSFADLVFVGERIEAGLKRGKFDHPALMNEKTRANEEDERKEMVQYRNKDIYIYLGHKF